LVFKYSLSWDEKGSHIEEGRLSIQKKQGSAYSPPSILPGEEISHQRKGFLTRHIWLGRGVKKKKKERRENFYRNGGPLYANCMEKEERLCLLTSKIL